MPKRKEQSRSPPAPDEDNGHTLDAIFRVAEAANYSAAQLAAIARAVEKIEARLANMDEDRQSDEDNLVFKVRSKAS